MITIIIPAYNEESRISKTVEAFSKYFPNDKILIVPNGCTDNTEKIAENLSKQFENVSSYAIKTPAKGEAIYVGISRTSTDFVGFVDADLATAPEQFAKLIPHIKNHECVIGSRWLPGSVVINREPLSVLIASRALNLMVRNFFGIDVRDTQCGAKLFKTKFVKKISRKCVVNDMTFDVELLWKIKNAGGKIKEVPIAWRHEKLNSKTHVIRNSLKMLKCFIMMMRTK